MENPKKTKPKVLTTKQKSEVIAILSVGCPRKTAARYVGCSPAIITRTAEKDPDFAEQLQRAQEHAEIASMKNIHNAAKQERYWKASAWILERKNPEAFRLQNPDLLSLEQVKLLVTHLSSIVVNEVKSPAQRKKILDELEKFLKNFGEIKPAG